MIKSLGTIVIYLPIKIKIMSAIFVPTQVHLFFSPYNNYNYHKGLCPNNDYRVIKKDCRLLRCTGHCHGRGVQIWAVEPRLLDID